MTLTIEYVAPGVLNPAPYNPRRMDDDAMQRLKRGIAEFGLVDPLIARREDGLLIGGHQRLRACTELGWTTVPVIYLSGVDDQRAAALNVLLNNPHAQGEWDMSKLAELLSTLDAEGFDASLTGFNDMELTELLTWTPDALQGSHSTRDEDGEGGDVGHSASIIKIQVNSVEQLLDVTNGIREYLESNPLWDTVILDD